MDEPDRAWRGCFYTSRFAERNVYGGHVTRRFLGSKERKTPIWEFFVPSGRVILASMTEPTKALTSSGVKLSLVIPTPKDPKEIGNLVAAISEVLNNSFHGKYEIILVSGDPTSLSAASGVAGTNASLRVVHDTEGSPIEAGWHEAKGDILATINGNQKEITNTLLELVGELNKGSDLTVCTRYGEKKAGDGVSATCFAIKKARLPNLEESAEGYQLILEMLGPDAVKRLMEKKDQQSVWTHFVDPKAGGK